MPATLSATTRILLAGAIVTSAVPSLAASPTTDDCITASERAVASKSRHQLLGARAEFLVCAAASCPVDVRAECERRVSEVSAAIPTVVLEAKDRSGNDVTAVKVTMDGQLITERLEGVSIPLDPGAHLFVFEASGLPAIQRTIVINEGEKDRREQIVFGEPVALVPMAPITPPPASPPPLAPRLAPPSQTEPARLAETLPTPPPAPYWTGRRTAGAALTGVGVAILGIGGLVGVGADVQFNSAVGETGTRRVGDSASAVRTGNVASGIVAVGGVVAAAGLVVWLTAPSAPAALGISGNELVVRGAF